MKKLIFSTNIQNKQLHKYERILKAKLFYKLFGKYVKNILVWFRLSLMKRLVRLVEIDEPNCSIKQTIYHVRIRRN